MESRSKASAAPVTAVRNAPKQQRSRATLERIFQVAGAAFDELGVDRCSMEEIARRSGLSIGALYRFFASKKLLVRAMAETYRAQQSERAASLWDPSQLSKPTDQFVAQFLEGLLDLSKRQPGFVGLVRSGQLFGYGPSEEWTDRMEVFFEIHTPALSHERRHSAAIMIQRLTGWLLVAASSGDSPLEEALLETRTVMVGYIHQLMSTEN